MFWFWGFFWALLWDVLIAFSIVDGFKDNIEGSAIHHAIRFKYIQIKVLFYFIILFQNKSYKVSEPPNIYKPSFRRHGVEVETDTNTKWAK